MLHVGSQLKNVFSHYWVLYMCLSHKNPKKIMYSKIRKTCFRLISKWSNILFWKLFVQKFTKMIFFKIYYKCGAPVNPRPADNLKPSEPQTIYRVWPGFELRKQCLFIHAYQWVFRKELKLLTQTVRYPVMNGSTPTIELKTTALLFVALW